MKLLDTYLDECDKTAMNYDLKLRFIGDLSKLDASLAEKARKLEEKTCKNSLTLSIAINYGGKDEIVHAVNSLIADGKSNITSEDIASRLYTSEIPDPDLIVRTAGEMRLSNFLMWQSAYSEFYFTETLWPDLTPGDIDKAVEEFYTRQRRYGKV